MLGDFGTRKRRPWVAVVISLFQPFLGMLFLNRGRWALVYLAVQIALIVFFFIALPTFPSPEKVAPSFQTAIGLITLVGACHCFFIARKWDNHQALHRYARRWYMAAIAYYGLFGILLAVRTYLYQPFNVPSAAMIPTVNVGDFFLAEKSAYNSAGPERGDIIVFHTPMFGNTTFFKRVVGLPGDHIQMKNSLLNINGSIIPRTRLADISVVCGKGHCAAQQYRETLPSERSYLVIQLDPTGPGNNTDVVTVPAFTYFVLGDNRDNSADSRTSLGYVRRDRILGRVAFKYITDRHWTWQAIN